MSETKPGARGYSWADFEPGNKAARRHGANDPDALTPLADEIRTELVAEAPWLDRPAYTGALRSLSYAEAELLLRRRWISEHGLVDDDGNDRPGSDRLERAEARAARLRDALGLTPHSQASLLSKLASVAVAGGDDGGLEALKAEGARILASRRAELEGGDS